MAKKPKKKRLSVKQFLKLWPDTVQRENCLTDMACPSCGQRDHFRVAALVEVDLCDDGTDRYNSDCEWDEKSRVSCGNKEDCGFEGIGRDFIFSGLDAELSKRIKEKTTHGDNSTD